MASPIVHPTATENTPATPPAVDRTLSVWFQIERGLAVLAFTLIGALIFGDVALREFGGPIGAWFGIGTGAAGVYGAGKISTYLLVIAAFTGLAMSVATGTQIVPRVAFGWVPASWGPVVNRFGNITSAAILFAVAYYGYVFVMASRDVGTVTPGLEWPAWRIQAVIPLGFASAGLRYVAFAIWPGAAPKIQEFQE